MQQIASRFEAVHVDFGTGDGKFVRRCAVREPAVLFVGVDAIADNLRVASRSCPANALFGRLALEHAPGELEAFADRLTVLFPWGSLLRAVGGADPEALAPLRAICKPGASARFLLELPDGPASLVRTYREAGFEVRARPVPIEEARDLPTTWAKKLGYSGKQRWFWELAGHAQR